MNNMCLDILKDLLRIESVTDAGATAMAEYIIERYLEPAGVAYRRVLCGGRTNLMVAINCEFSDDLSNALLMSGHMDTVAGTIDIHEEDGKLYGRGAVDMKFFIAAILSLIPFFKTLSYPVLFAMSADEETAFNGIGALIKFCTENNIKPKYCIVGEPTNMKLALSSQGAKVFYTKFNGKAAHSSMPKMGSNAIETCVQFINMLKHNPQINDNPNNSVTYNIAEIHGGIADNIIPESCALTCCFRFSTPDEERIITNAVSECARAVIESAKYPIDETISLYIKSFVNWDSAFAAKIKCAIPKIETDNFSGGTEAGYWHEYGADTVIFGIGPMSCAHAENEHILIADLSTYTVMLQKICTSI